VNFHEPGDRRRPGGSPGACTDLAAADALRRDRSAAAAPGRRAAHRIDAHACRSVCRCGGKRGQTRRLSIAPGQDATFDLDAYGLRGTFDLELVSFRPVTVSLLEPRDRQTREVETAAMTTRFLAGRPP
jgi:hypothetical protein